MHCQQISHENLQNYHPKRNCLGLLSNSLNLFFMEMYGDQFGEFVCGDWDLKGYPGVKGFI